VPYKLWLSSSKYSFCKRGRNISIEPTGKTHY
jgi:hypothetical protein